WDKGRWRCKRARGCLRRVGEAVLTLAVTLCVCVSTEQIQAAEPPWRVLILQGYDPWLPSTIQLDQAMRQALHASGPRLIDIYTEALDSGRFRSEELEDAFLALLRKKDARDKPGVVMAGAPFALDFALRHRAELWPETPIVFFGIPEGSLAQRALPANVTGQFIRYDAAGTLALALALSPDTRRVLVVGGVTDADQARVRSALDAAAQLAPGRDIDRLDHLAFSGILRNVSRQPRESIVLFMGFYRDAHGDTYVPQTALEKLATASAVPVYSHFGGLIGHGIVGGAVTDFEREGREIG